VDSSKSFTPTTQIGVGCAEISDNEKKYVMDALNNNRLSHGPYLTKFESEFAKQHELKYAIFCNSGTSALQVGLHAMKDKYGWQDGDEVLCPSVTFIASSNVILQNRLQPVFVDVDPDYYEIDPAKIEEKISPKTKAIMVVHLFGQPCDMEPIVAIAKKHNLRIIEDSCETMFVRHKGQMVGTWGDVSCYSTYVAHLLVTGVGGFACTSDDDLVVSIKSLMNHGRDGIYLHIDDDKNQSKEQLFSMVARRFRFVNVGYSYRGTEMEGALGVGQLEIKDQILARRQKNAATLTEGLKDLESKLQLPKIRPETEHAFMMYPIVAANDVNRDDLVNYLEERQIETRPMLPLLNQPVYIELFGNLEDQYPQAKRINNQGFYIGCHQGLKPEEIDYMIDTFHQYFK
jgi:perosamine synthetase